MNNLVVCLAEANRAKGDRYSTRGFRPKPARDTTTTIYWHNVAGFHFKQAAGDSSRTRWNSFESRTRLSRPPTERKRSTCRGQHAHILAYLYDEKSEGSQRVRAIPGKMTALLRRGWGLNGMLSESGEEPDRAQAARRPPPSRHRRIRRGEYYAGASPAVRARRRVVLGRTLLRTWQG